MCDYRVLRVVAEYECGGDEVLNDNVEEYYNGSIYEMGMVYCRMLGQKIHDIQQD